MAPRSDADIAGAEDVAEGSPARLRLIHVYSIGAGAMFSSGFFLLPGLAAAETGPSLPLAYLLAGLLVLPTMLAVTELAVAMPFAGGPYHFFRRALGPTVATVGGIGLWVALVLKSAFALVGIDAYLTLVVDLPEASVGLTLAVVFTALNILGAQESARLQVGLVAVLLAVLGAFLVFGGIDAAQVGTDELTDRFSPLFTDGVTGLLAATAIVFVAFAGLPQVASVAGEIRDPGRAIPRGILLALGTATAVYVAGTALLVVNLPADELRGDRTPIATAADTFAMPMGMTLIVIAALAAFASTGNAGVMSASRYPLALARDGLAWRRFARLNGAGVPVASVIVTGVAVASVVVAFDVASIAKLASAFVLVSFGLLNASVIVLRRARVPDYRPTFRMPGYPWLPATGIVTSAVLIVDLGVTPTAAVVGLGVLAVGWYRFASRGEPGEPGALLRRLRRRRHLLESGDLQELGPTSDDRAPEILERLHARRVESPATIESVRSATADALADAERVSPGEAREWLHDRHHLVVDDAADELEVHLVRVDGPGEPVVVIGWAPAGTGERGPTVAVVAGPTHDSDRLRRLTALVSAQLATDELCDAWPDEADDVAHFLAADASLRQGADPAR